MKDLVTLVFILHSISVCLCGEFLEPPASLSLHSFSEAQTRLPCKFAVMEEERVVQVTWSRQKASGGEIEQIITAHFTDGVRVSPDFQKRVQLESSDPTTDSTLLILSTKTTDQAIYTCHVSTFPSGSFQRLISLSVWIVPISSLEPVVLQEGESFGLAASCRSMGHPQPRLTWDTDIPGRSQNRSGEDGVVTSQFFLHPVRSMNGQRLDCLVWHPALNVPRRLQSQLIVHYPPDAEIQASGLWQVGQVGAQLTCVVRGNPLPENITWTREGISGLPNGVLLQDNRMVFRRPLNVSDQGVYFCRATSSSGATRVQFRVEISERVAAKMFTLGSNSDWLLLIVVGASGVGLLVLVVVIVVVWLNCHLRHTNKKLKRALSRNEELMSLSRQASMRRLNSFTSDPRTQVEDESLTQMECFMKSSILSEEDHSTFTDLREQHLSGDYDSLGRPAIKTPYRPERINSRQRESEEEKERKRRVESYIKSSNMSLDSGLHRDQSSRPASVVSGPAVDTGDGWKRSSRKEIQKETVAECDGDSDGPPYKLSEASNNYFQCSNGRLTPREKPNAIILPPRRLPV